MNTTQIKQIQHSLQKIKSIRPFRYSISVLPVDLSTNSCNVKLPFDNKPLFQSQFESFKEVSFSFEEVNVKFDYKVVPHKKGIVERYEVAKYPDLVYSPRTGDKLKDMDFYFLSNIYIKGENILDINHELYNFLKNQKGAHVSIAPYSLMIEFSVNTSDISSIKEVEEHNTQLKVIQTEMYNILNGMKDVIKEFEMKIFNSGTSLHRDDYICNHCSEQFKYSDIKYPNYCYHCGHSLKVTKNNVPLKILSCSIELI